MNETKSNGLVSIVENVSKGFGSKIYKFLRVLNSKQNNAPQVSFIKSFDVATKYCITGFSLEVRECNKISPL